MDELNTSSRGTNYSKMKEAGTSVITQTTYRTQAGAEEDNVSILVSSTQFSIDASGNVEHVESSNTMYNITQSEDQSESGDVSTTSKSVNSRDNIDAVNSLADNANDAQKYVNNNSFVKSFSNFVKKNKSPIDNMPYRKLATGDFVEGGLKLA